MFLTLSGLQETSQQDRPRTDTECHQKLLVLPKFKRKILAGRKFKEMRHWSHWVEKNVETATYSCGWMGKVTSTKSTISLMSSFPIKIVLSLAHFDVLLRWVLDLHRNVLSMLYVHARKTPRLLQSIWSQGQYKNFNFSISSHLAIIYFLDHHCHLKHCILNCEYLYMSQEWACWLETMDLGRSISYRKSASLHGSPRNTVLWI